MYVVFFSEMKHFTINDGIKKSQYLYFVQMLPTKHT